MYVKINHHFIGLRFPFCSRINVYIHSFKRNIQLDDFVFFFLIKETNEIMQHTWLK